MTDFQTINSQAKRFVMLKKLFLLSLFAIIFNTGICLSHETPETAMSHETTGAAVPAGSVRPADTPEEPPPGEGALTWRAPGFAMSYHADMGEVDMPSTIVWTLRIENTGDTPLTGISINSRVPESFSGPEADGDQAAMLNIGETWVFTGEFAVTQEVIDRNGVDDNNVIDGNGYIDSAITVVFAETDPQNTAASVQVVQNPGFTVTQQADIPSINRPATITYNITIENTGNLSLTDIRIFAPLLVDLKGPEGDIKNPGSLDVGEVWTYTGVFNATQAIIDGNGVDTYNVIDGNGYIDSTVIIYFAETDAPQTAYATVGTTLTITGDIFEKKYRHLHAFVSLKRSYTTNFYRTYRNPVSVWSTHITPGIWATYPAEMKRSVEIVTAKASPGGLAIDTFNPVDFKRFQAYMLYSPQFQRYHGLKSRPFQEQGTGPGIIINEDIDGVDERFSGASRRNDLNRTTHRVDAMLHYHSGNKLSVRAKDQYKINYDPISERSYFSHDRYRSNMLYIAGTLDPTQRIQLRLDYNNFRLDYRDRINNDDDRRDHVYSAYLFFRATAKTSLFLEYDYADINYRTSPRDSYEHRYFGGIRWEMTGKSSGQIKGGYGRKRWDDSSGADTDIAISDVSSSNWIAAIQLDHNLTAKTNLTFNAYRRYDEILEHRYNYGELDKFYADYIMTHFVGFKLSWNALRNTHLNLDAALFYDKFKGSRLRDRDGKAAERKDLNFAISPTLTIDLFRHLNLNGGYIYTDHYSNYPDHDYVDHTFFIRASLHI